MKISTLTIITVLACQVLSSCNTVNAGQNKQSANVSNKDTCGRQHFEVFVGTPFDNLKLRDDISVDYGQMDNGSGVWKWENRTYFLRVFDPRLVPEEDMVVTSDYSPNRLNVALNEDGKIKSLDCY